MDWIIQEILVCFLVDSIGSFGSIYLFDEQKVFYCFDIKQVLLVVLQCYQVVQLCEVLEFYCDFIEVFGYELEMVGVLKGGKKFWVLVKIGQLMLFKGSDLVNGYLLLVMLCDGMLVIMVMFIIVCVVCNNMFVIVVNGVLQLIKVGYCMRFDV